jgi:hypothetical protein
VGQFDPDNPGARRRLVIVATSFTGIVLLDDDEQNPYRVNINDLDRAHWVAGLVSPGSAVMTPTPGAVVHVKLHSGRREGESADARFVGEVLVWLEGQSPFAP